MVVLSGNQFTAEEEPLYPPFCGSVDYKIAMQARRRSTGVSSSNGFRNCVGAAPDISKKSNNH